MEYSTEKQHKMFGTWLKATELKLDREALSGRWATVCRILENVDYAMATFLVDYSFDLPFSQPLLQKFQEEFHTDDSMFIMEESENQTELKNLASVLVILLLEDIDLECEEFNPIIANYVLSVSCAGLREASIHNITILDSANKIINKYAVDTRERKSFSIPENQIWKQAEITTAIDSVEVADVETIKNALKKISDTSKAVLTQEKTNNKNLLSNIKHLVKIQDEELNILWWLINSYSSLRSCPFCDLDDREKPLILAMELAKLTALKIEIPSARVIFQKAGLESSEELTFSEFIEGTAQLNELIATIENDIGINTPVFFTLKNKLQDEGGVNNINDKLHINNTNKICDLEWALQIYREILAIDSMKEYS